MVKVECVLTAYSRSLSCCYTCCYTDLIILYLAIQVFLYTLLYGYQEGKVFENIV